jgi:hypothetical protein
MSERKLTIPGSLSGEVSNVPSFRTLRPHQNEEEDR